MKIAIDFDNVLVPFCETWNDWLYKTGRVGEPLSVEDVDSYDYHVKVAKDAKDFFLKNPHHTYRNMTPYEGAKDFLDYCKENYEEVFILTHASRDSTKSAKINYSIKNFNFYDVRFVDSVTDKYKAVGDAVLIDDYPATCIKHSAFNKYPSIIFDLEGRFGWSKFRNYSDLFEEVNASLNLIYIANTYDEVKTLLRNRSRYR